MTYVPNSGFVVPEFTLAADVTNGSTITLSYPTGSQQTSFIAGMAVPNGSYMVVNRQDHVQEDVTSAAGVAFSFGSSNITVTNNTGKTLTAGTVLSFWLDVRDGPNADLLAFPMQLASISAADLITIEPGVDGIIENMEFITTVVATTGSKLATLSLKINSVAVTGSGVALTSANQTPVFNRVVGSQITAANRITKNDVLKIVGSTVTAFVEGAGVLYVRIRSDKL